MVLNCNLSYANQDDNFELERFNVVVERMRENFQKIKDMKASRKVIGHERGFLDPFDRANLSPDEQKILEQENKDRSEYFSFLAKHSNSIHRHEKPPMPDRPAVSYEEVAQYFAKKWKEWPPRQ